MKTQIIGISALALAGCAATATTPGVYNPDRISQVRITQISQICQSVMGLNPSDPLTDNQWPGDPDPAHQTNRFRGCVTALSNSLVNLAVANSDKLADAQCRSKGLPPGSPEFGVCIVNLVDAKLTPLKAPSTQVVPFSKVPAEKGDSRSSAERRKQLSCAEIGLEPGQPSFASCIDGLKRVLADDQMDGDYTN